MCPASPYGRVYWCSGNALSNECDGKNYSELVKELQRQLPINKIAETLQRLVSERVSIRDLRLIFGTLIDWAPREKMS